VGITRIDATTLIISFVNKLIKKYFICKIKQI